MSDESLGGFSRAVVWIDFVGGPRLLEPRAAGDVGDGYPFRHPVHIITAYNPSGNPDSDVSNAKRHGRLAAEVAELGLEFVPTVGSAPDGSLPEPGLLVQGLGRLEAVRLGKRFGQAAIYEWRRERLDIVGAMRPGTLTLGWELVASA